MERADPVDARIDELKDAAVLIGLNAERSGTNLDIIYTGQCEAGLSVRSVETAGRVDVDPARSPILG